MKRRQLTDSNLVETVDCIEMPSDFVRSKEEPASEMSALTPTTKLKQFTLTKEHVML